MQSLQKLIRAKMSRAKFILFLVLGTFAHVTISVNHDFQRTDSNNKFSNPTKAYTPSIFGKSIAEVEKSVKSFIRSLSNPSVKHLVQDLQKTSLGDDFKKSVSISTKVVVENLRGFRKDLGILKYQNPQDREISLPQQDDTLETNLIHNGLEIISEIVDFVLTGCETGNKFLLGDQTSGTRFINSNWRKSQYLDLIIFADELFIYIDCMTKDSSIEDIKKAVDYGSTHSTNEVMSYLRKNLKKPPPSRNSNLTQAICSAIENIKPGGYEECINNWENIHSCFESRNSSKAVNSSASSKSHEFLKMMKKLFPRKWVKNVRDLNRSCKLKEDQQFECTFKEKQLKGTRNQVKYIVENYTTKKIITGSPLSRVVNRFSRVISRSPVAKSLVRSGCEYIAISRAGEERQQKLKKMSKGNPRVFKEFKKVSKSLYNYKKGIVQDLLNAIVEFNQIPIYLEKSLAKTTPKIEGWPLFTTILACLSVWINSLFDKDKNTFNSKANAGVIYHKNFQRLIQIQEEFPDLKPKISAELAFNNLLKTMNQMSRQNRDLNRNSSFNAGLTNVLLVLMFLETLSAVTLLMSQNLHFIPEIPERPGSQGPGSQESSWNQGSQEENEGDEDEKSMDRKKRSSDLDPNTIIVSDLPDLNIPSLNSSKNSFHHTNYSNAWNNKNDSVDSNDSIYEIRENMLAHYENIGISRMKNPKFDYIETSEDNYLLSWKFNNTILKADKKNL